MMILDNAVTTPLYQQIYAQIKQDIGAGNYHKGTCPPGGNPSFAPFVIENSLLLIR